MDTYCTYFDRGYLTRALAMLDSLRRVYDGNGFQVFALVLDDASYNYCKSRAPDYLVPVRLGEVEDESLRSVKPHRSRTEYYWTLTPSFIRYVLARSGASQVTYLDADLYFWSNPQEILQSVENSGCSVGITPHRYTPKYDQSATSGTYCVQFMPFHNDAHGHEVVNWWRDRCIEWCYARPEDGKFGDQKYLDDWDTRFSAVSIITDDGVGVAPWNVQQYEIEDRSQSRSPMLIRKTDGYQLPIVFYHFHNLRFLKRDRVDFGNYQLSRGVIRHLYQPYLTVLSDMENRLVEKGFKLDALRRPISEPITWKTYPRKLRRVLKRTYNVYPLKRLI